MVLDRIGWGWTVADEQRRGAPGHSVPTDLATGRAPIEWEIYMREVLSRLASVESGGGSGGGPSYLYQQVTASDTWTIVHNFNADYGYDGYPIVNVVDGTGQQVIGEVHYQDVNTVVVLFADPEVGYAYLRG